MHAIKPCRLLWLTSNNFTSWRVCEFVMQLGASVVYIMYTLDVLSRHVLFNKEISIEQDYIFVSMQTYDRYIINNNCNIIYIIIYQPKY